jgi:hypothetical protein
VYFEAALTVSHDSKGDTCEAIVPDQIVIDLLPLQADYKEVTLAINGVIFLYLEGLLEPVLYSF